MAFQMQSFDEQNVLSYEEITKEVSENFTIIDSFLRSDGAVEYKVMRTEDTKENFLSLWSTLKKKNYIPILRKGEPYLTLYVAPYVKRKKYSYKVGVALLAATMASLLIDGWLRASSSESQKIFPDWNPLVVTLSYAIAFIGILGLHEVGHLVMSRKRGLSSTMPYFIPGIPGSGVPTFGAIIFATEPMVNKDTQFDVGLFGPISGFIAALFVGFFGVLTSVPMTLDDFTKLFGAGEASFVDVPLIMNLMLIGTGKVSSSQQMVVILSPLAYAAWFGLLITFLNTLPAWQLDGGHMSRSVLTDRQQRIATLLSAVVMTLFGFFLMAMLILFLSFGQNEIKPLDEVSPLSKSRKLIYGLVLIVTILCAPIPL
jgi:membrane-associated protease RseP (regulator of RpoE activity)